MALLTATLHLRQVCGGYADSMARCAQLLEEHTSVDFIDINMGCPIDLVCGKCGSRSSAISDDRGLCDPLSARV